MSSLETKPSRTRSALERFFGSDSARGAPVDPAARALELFQDTAATVPAYRAFLAERRISPAQITSANDFARVPVTTKENYHRKYALTDLCRNGRLGDCEMLAVSSGSTGEPAIWPRSFTDELATAARFEQVLDEAFGARSQRTLGVICFALGTWVGGMYTAACCRQLAMKGFPLTLVTPGNQKPEILRVLRSVAADFEQIVLFGYPPFLKDVIDTARSEGFDWSRHRVRLVMAGEVFSEPFRSLVCERIGAADPAYATASLYGTADGGVLANETPLSIRIRRALGDNPSAARALFGESRLPTLCQYDPSHRYFEVEPDGSLLFTGDGGIPLVRYKILDRGGIVGYAAMREFLAQHGVSVEGGPALFDAARPQPFVFVFGRSNFAVSYYGANVYPENVSIGVERAEFADEVTGKFVLEIAEDVDHDPRLCVTVELAPGKRENEELAGRLAAAILHELMRLNSEFSNYTPAERRRPEVRLLPHADPGYFPLGVKHRYTRQ